MQAVVWHDVGDIRLEEVSEPQILEPTDAIVRITASAICGTDLHMVRGTVPGMQAGTILGHEGVGIVEAVGTDVRNFAPGDRVVIPSTIACGYCAYCRDGYYSQCDTINPHGKLAGGSFFGGPETSGPFPGLQAEKARIPFAAINLVKLPDAITDEQALMLSDIFPTGYFGAELADIKPGHTVAIFGCGPVGQCAIASAKLMGTGRILAIDCIPSRLETARAQGAEVIDYEAEDPVATIHRLTGGIGVDRVIDAVGIDANHPHHGPGQHQAKKLRQTFAEEVRRTAPRTQPQNGNWEPGDAPSQVLRWAVQSVAKAGTIAIIGVYPATDETFPIGEAMHKNLTLRMGNCPHRRYIPLLINLVLTGAVDPYEILSEVRPFSEVIEAYQAFDKRAPGWMKVALEAAL